MPGNDNNIFSRAGSSASTAERNTSPALQVLKSKRLPEWLRIRLVLRRHSVRCAMRSSREKEHVVRVFLASLKSSTLVKHPRASNALWARRDVWDGPSPTPNQFSVHILFPFPHSTFLCQYAGSIGEQGVGFYVCRQLANRMCYLIHLG